MLKRIKPYIKCVVFVAGLVVIIALCDFLFAKTGYINYILRQADSDKVNYDEFVLGASHARCAIDPEYIEEKQGITVLNMSVPGETIKDSYYLLQELDRNNNVKRIVLDIDYNYWFGELGEGCFAEAFMYNQYSWGTPVKWRYLLENPQYLDIRNAFTKKYVYETNIASVKLNVKQKISDDYKKANIYSLDTSDAGGPYKGKGFFALPLPLGNPVGEEYVKKQMGIEQQDINPYPEKYFRKLVRYCKNNNIELICVTSPITPGSMKRLNIDVAYGKLTTLFNELGVQYYDCNLLRYDVLQRKDEDYIDKEGHMGGELAEHYSDVLSDILNKHENGTLKLEDYMYDSYDELYNNLGE